MIWTLDDLYFFYFNFIYLIDKLSSSAVVVSFFSQKTLQLLRSWPLGTTGRSRKPILVHDIPVDFRLGGEAVSSSSDVLGFGSFFRSGKWVPFSVIRVVSLVAFKISLVWFNLIFKVQGGLKLDGEFFFPKSIKRSILVLHVVVGSEGPSMPASVLGRFDVHLKWSNTNC